MKEDDLLKTIEAYKGATYSQLLQDVFVLSLTNFKTDGFFVEFGACDGKLFSNSLLLEKEYNWHGILSEPLKSFHESLQKNRDCIIDYRAVFSQSAQQIEFRELLNNPDLSGLVDTFLQDNHVKKRNKNYTSYNVETVSLNDLLNQNSAPPIIDYVSIDTEGSELNILSAFDFELSNFL